ncbi:MAG: hypothetical protein ACK47B_01160 [Armatimonadota bacterium]
MEDAGQTTVARLIEILAGRAPISQAPEIIAPDVVSHMDGFTFGGFRAWANWLSYVRTHSRVGAPDLVTDRLVANEDGTITAYGRWKGCRDGAPALSGEVWARYRVVGGRIEEIWTTRTNYVFVLGPIMESRLGLLVVMLRVFCWSRLAGKRDSHPEPAASGGAGDRLGS